uniref:K Homology domain-containing protein n=1 Tax=Globisporangium ultimum (strain ATCC 200006 / CBS 805.95 / DAOM BR144) TaxID=431595 RepID=K3WDW4_GLOUD
MAAPSDADLLVQMQKRLESVTAAKEANATIGKKLDEKLRIAFKNPPRRPNMAIDSINQEIRAKELKQTTTSISNSEEKIILRDLQLLKEKLGQWQEHDKFQEWVEQTRKERNERFQKNKEYDQQIQQLNVALKKVKVAAKIGAAVADFVTIEVTVPEDRMGAVIGKQFANLRQLELDCGVILDVDNKLNIVKITSTQANTLLAKESIENITLATNHSIGLHPDTVKVLMVQKSKNLHELEKNLQLKIDINRAEGILTVNASPAKAKLLDKAIKELVAGKTDIQLPAEIVPKLIGKKGETINQLMENTGCLVDIDKVTNSVRLCGTKESVAMAKKFVLDLVDEQSQREKDFYATDAKYFASPEFADFKFDFFAEFLMANKAQQLKVLRTDAMDAKIKVSKHEKKINVIGTKKQLAAMDEALSERLRAFESHHWLYELADNFILSLIIGKKGANIKEIEKEFASSNVRIDIQGNYVCVFGDDQAAIESAKAKIMDVVDQNQRSFFLTSQYLVTVLMTNKRAKLNEIEQSSACKLKLPPPPTAGATNNSTRTNDEAQVKITLTGTLDAITSAKRQLEELEEAHHVRYLPLDDDEIPTVIGKKGETISQLETASGAKLKVLKEANTPSELEMIGTEEQLASVQKAIDELLQTKNRQILQLDAFAAGCLIGKKGERIKALRVEHPDANVDAFPNRGQVRIKAASPEALQACTEHVLKTLRETLVVESVKVPQQQASQPGGGKSGGSGSVNFNTILKKYEAIAMRLQELEAEGGESMKVTIQEDGKLAKIRGPAMGIGTLKKFLEMIVDPESHFIETIKLPKLSFANVLLVKGSESEGKLNENALRICKQTGCEIRVKRSTTNGANDEGVIRIEGTNASKVYEAKSSVENVLQFYFTDNFQVLEDLPQTVVPRLYELQPTLAAKYRVVFSLPSQTSLRVFTDSKQKTGEVMKILQQELQAWKKQHVELPVAAWLVPLLVGKSGETIKKLSAECNGAKLDLSGAPSSSSHKNSASRVLTISARDDATVKLAVEKVNELIKHHENLTSIVTVSKEKLDLVLSAKKDASGMQFHVVGEGDKEDAQLQVVLYGSDYEARERIVEKIEHLLETCVIEKIVLPSTLSPSVTSSVIGALIGKSGANIRALQKEFPSVVIDIRKSDNSISLKGPKDDVLQVKSVMEDKVEELLRNQELRNARYQTQDANEVAEEEKKPAASKNTAASAEQEVQGDESTKPQSNAMQRNRPPVGGSASMMTQKLDKNQRRRMRKRAEKENQSDVLSMIMGGSTTTTTTITSSSTTKSSEDSGYYHSSSGYSLRL